MLFEHYPPAQSWGLATHGATLIPEDHDAKLSKIPHVSLSPRHIVLGRFLLPVQIAFVSAEAPRVTVMWLKGLCHFAVRIKLSRKVDRYGTDVKSR